MQCLECCGRLVASTYPLKEKAAIMLSVIKRFPGSPGREQVLESARQWLEKHPSASRKSTTP